MRTRKRRKFSRPSGRPTINSTEKRKHSLYSNRPQDSYGSIDESKSISRRNNIQLPAILVTFLYLSTNFKNYFNIYEQQEILLQQVACEQVSRFPQQQVPFLNPTSLQRTTNLPELIVQQGGIIKDKNVTLTKQQNPILITKDIVIKKDAKLTIEAGTQILFDKRKGIIVHGILEILGNSNDRVRLNSLKSHQSATVNFRSQNNNPIRQQQIRLVDGDVPSEGRVQIKFNDQWHSLCTSSKNLTAADIKVICQQVGFQDGHWYKWFPRRNDTAPHQMMSKSFHCNGGETAITQCKRWNRVRAGGGVCNYHSDIGIRCSKTLVFAHTDSQSYNYWRGIEFVNSETMFEYVLDSQMKQKTSKSILRHLIVGEAGLNEAGNATGAIVSRGQPPRMKDVEIRNSIYGIVIEDADNAFKLDGLRLMHNLGQPLFVNTSWGKIFMNNLHIENNGGDGVRVVRHEKFLVGSHDFCKFANLGASQSFPVVLSHEQTFFTSGRECCQEFTSNNQLTARFPVLRSTPNNLLPETDNNRKISIPPGVSLGRDANLVIYDDYRDEYPFRLRIQNATRAQSIVSRSGRLKICYEPANYRTVLFTIEIVANSDDQWSGIARDVEISNSYIKGNEGRGIWIDNQRSGVLISNTTVINHNYIAGVHLENGTGELIVQGGRIGNNSGHGLYINLAGGYYHIDNTTISDNSLKGVLLEYDKRPELVHFNHTFHLGYSLIARNGENGLFIGNVCRSDASWNVSMNSFMKNGEDAILFQSCLPSPEVLFGFRNLTSRFNLSNPEGVYYDCYQDLLITHNVFISNTRRAISMSPVFFVKSFIRHNLFKEHQLATLLIGNQPYQGLNNEHSDQASANVRVASNRFYSNRGRYVANIGLQEDNPKHSLIFTKNTLEDNVITEPYPDLRPRSRVSAVVVVSSSNTRVIRNRFNNPQSPFEFGTHLEVHSKVINATTNHWGRVSDAMSIYKRIFDRKNRYNLAQVEFLQYLLSPEDLEYATDLSFDRERDKITTFKDGTRLGGEIKGFEELDSDTYIVQDDLFVRPGAHLILRPGTVLKFYDGVGVMVQGRLSAVGQPSSQILLTSAISANRTPQRISSTTTPSPQFNSWVSHQPDGGLDDDNEAISVNNNSLHQVNRFRSLDKRQIHLNTGPCARLSHTTMGKLEVQIDGVWGSVCDYNFDINDAAVACQQLGMILNKEDWLLERFQYATNDQQQFSMMTNNALMTNLQCDPSLDTDITKCKAEISLRGDFDGMCNSEVGIRCFPPSWSGVRLGMGAETSAIEHVTIQKAGMFDYAAYILRPALQIDLNKHLVSSIVVKSNSDSGVGIVWNDVIGRHFSELSLVDSKFLNNERHGIELKSKGLTIKGCTISNNRQSGLDYNPTLSQDELDDLLSWIQTAKNSDNVVPLSFPLQNKYFPVSSSEDSYKFFIFQKHPQPDLMETFTIGTDPGHMLSIHLLNPIHPDSTESLNMFLGLNPESPVWDFRLNLTSIPMVSPGYKFHFNYSSGRTPRGNIVLYIRSRYNNRDLRLLSKHIPQHLVTPKFDQTAININSRLINSLIVTNSNITKNGIGLRFRHPNYPYGPQASYNIRYANETTNITQNTFEGNHFSGIFVGSDDFETNFGALNKSVPGSEIRYNILSNKFRRNKDGIRQFSRDIRYSYNVFHWSINDTLFEFNKGGGVNIVLPYYWRYDINVSHSMDVNNNVFSKNMQFEFIIDGHYAELNVTRNMFKENKCRNSLISIAGMEKRMLIRQNTIEQNICNRIVDFDIKSHADKMGSVPSQFSYNSLRNNRRHISNTTSPLSSKQSRILTRLHPHTTDYTMSISGVQSLNITRNILVNPELRFELVVAINMDAEERIVSATENYWGSVLYSEISERIYDFDDWNSYATVEVSPYLTLDSFTAATILSEPRDSYLYANRPLGGRLTKSMTLPYRKEPYVVESDFTIMPNVRLLIEKGAVLEFMPNVGILVLGDLVAAGTKDRPIQMRPALSASDILIMQQYLSPPKPKQSLIRAQLSDPLSYGQNYAFKHYQLAFPVDMGSLRLCKHEICNDGSHIYENNVEDPILRHEVLKTSNSTWKMDGFLEIFNMTTLQWVPVCDPLFTEQTARVVCRQLGYSHLSVFRRGRRYTIEQELISSIRNWPESVQCVGDEPSLPNCPLAVTAFTNHSAACSKDSNQFVYVYCSDFPEQLSTVTNHGLTNEHVHHWGGIRFSCPSASASGVQQESRETYNLMSQTPNPSRSRLQYLTIDRAGMLHRKRSPSIQVLQCNVQIEYVAITNSAHHGLEIITSQGNQNFHQLRLRNNLGVGLNYLSLTGSSSASRLVPYLPLKQLDISNDIFGLVDICGSSKELQIEDRVLIFFRYSSQAVDCVKIVSSKLHIKHIGIRMLQFHLFNSTAYTSKPDSIRIYDGNIFDRDSRLLVELGVTDRHRNEKPELKFYQSSDSTMTIRLHVSGASSSHGFIAEVVTTPVSYNIQRDTYNNLTFSELTNNKLGAISVASAGESSPNLILKNNRFESNCLHLFGNFTSCLNPIYMELQNCQRLKIVNNLIKNNQGGIMIKSYSHTAVSALEASIENNVFESNQNTNSLAMLGPRTDPYQTVKIARNFFTRNFAPYASNIVLSRIVANFSYNIISGNIGKHQIEVIGFDKLPLSYQTFGGNWIYNNTATLERDRSTIFGNSAGQQYHMNYLVNPDNHFEISTMNWSKYDVKPFGVPRDDEIIHLTSGDGSSKDLFRKTADAIPISIVDTKRIDLYQATINAKHNWWGFNTTSAIQGRIRDRLQHEELLKVDFVPFLETNRSVLSGVCTGGWQKVGNACLVYIGSRMTYQEAKDFCDRERATLPLLKGWFATENYEFTDFIQAQEREYDPRVDRIWVRSFDVALDVCPALNDHRRKSYNCQDRYSFLCEKDPQIIISLLHWHGETGGLVALILSLVTLVLTSCCTVCWVYKSRQRYKEKILRKSTIHASMRSNRGFPYVSTNNSVSQSSLQRQIYNPEKSSIDLSLSTQMTQTSNDLPNLIRTETSYHPRSVRTNENPSPIGRTYANSTPQPYFEPQPSLNPGYKSPLQAEQLSKPLTPAPSYREAHPRTLSKDGSRTPSYNGSQTGDVVLDPMPTLAPAYSQIDHRATQQQSFFKPQSTFYDPHRGASREQPSVPLYNLNRGNKMRDIDESESSVPTYYSNEIETYRESLQTFNESYNEAYNETIQRINNDHTSYILTGRSSITDLTINSSQLTQASTIDSHTNLINMRPQVPVDYAGDNEIQTGAHSNKAYSETPSGSQLNRYCVETSFEFDTPTMAQTSMFGSSQRLSPASSSYAPLDSKLGSRVYLETSFE